uniref:Uncharacterized protein n=1 Tax=Avena sativa TaxID=4498 RepID=A0ACD5T998_AVESA
MVRKQPLSSLFYAVSSDNKDTTPPSSPLTPTVTPQAWMWPSCKHPTTNSFRSPSASVSAAAAAKNAASLFVDSAESSSFTNSSARMHHDCAASDSLSTESEPSAAAAEDTADAIVRGLRSDRLRFEPRAPSSSILEKKPARGGNGPSSAGSFGGGVPLAFDSADPYRDFRASMAEMMTAHGASGDWDWLERMLGWYLRANGKDTHASIVAAFVDLVVTRTAACSSSSGHSSFTLAGSDLESSGAGGNGSFRLRRTKSSVSGSG